MTRRMCSTIGQKYVHLVRRCTETAHVSASFIKVHLGAREFRVRTMALAMEAETPCTPVGNGIV